MTPRKYQNVVGTPYEIFTGRKASNTDLLIFGCVAYAMVPMTLGQSKLADTSLLCCFAGYDEQRKAYRVDNPHNDTVVVTSQCRFDEEKFPFIDGLFDEIMVTSAPAIGITPASYGVMGVTPLFATDDTDEVTQDEPEIEIIDMCSSSENELSDTDSVVLVAEDETNEIDKAANQDDERSSIDDDEYPHLNLLLRLNGNDLMN